MSDTKRREWWIDPDPCGTDDDGSFYAYKLKPMQGPLAWQAQLVHVRQVIPGSREFTREELRQAYGRAYTKPWDDRDGLLGALMNELFGAEDEGTGE